MLKKWSIKRNINLWMMLSVVIVLFILIPSVNVLLNIFEKPSDVWFHIKEYLLPTYTKNTLILIFFTSVFTIIIGVSLAWIVSIYDFPLRKILQWGLLLPLSIPPYIAAYTYSGLFSYTGYLQVTLRNLLNRNLNPKYFDIMSIQGAIVIFTLFMYPYIYLISKSFLEKQSASLIESSRILGRNQFETFIYVGLPILKTSIIGGVILVVLEVLNDYGVVSYFGVLTYSTAIFTAWRSYGDIVSAVRLSALLMFIVFIILFLERLLRGRKSYGFSNTKIRPLKRLKLSGYKAILATLYALLILSFGFIIPIIQLFGWSLLTYKEVLNQYFIFMSLNTFVNALISTIVIIIASLIVANYSRLYRNRFSQTVTRIITLGYSIPGAVIAIAVITYFTMIDKELVGFYRLFNPYTKTLVLTSSIYMLLFAYVIRYMAIGYNSIETGFDKIGKTFSEASRTLGMNSVRTFFKVDIPMLKPAIFSATILVFIDVLKELPLTLILRPFNYNSLATKTFEYANDEMIHQAAIPALFIVIISVGSMMILNHTIRRD